MKAVLKKIALNKVIIFRKFILSLAFVSFFVVALYILINSPA